MSSGSTDRLVLARVLRVIRSGPRRSLGQVIADQRKAADRAFLLVRAFYAISVGFLVVDMNAWPGLADTTSVDPQWPARWLASDNPRTGIMVIFALYGFGAFGAAAFPRVREALLRRQRAFRQAPGLIADGRDMGTVVFPEAEVKIFLDASAEERAQRRYKQLQDKGFDVNFERLLTEIRERDDRDRNRAVAPLKPAEDALVVDSTSMTIDEVLATVLAYAEQQLGDASAS